MKNNKGAIIALSLSLVLAFILLGFAAVHFAGMQNEGVQKEVHDVRAFWLAEAGVEDAFFNLPGSLGNPYTVYYLGATGNYKWYSTKLSDVRWRINSTGSLSPKTRKIEAIVGPNVLKAFITTGGMEAPGAGGPDDHITPQGSYETYFDFSFGGEDGIFKISKEEMYALKDTEIIDPSNNPDTVDGIIWISWSPSVPENKRLLKITDPNWEHSGILIIEGDLEMEGGHFDGIIWVEGAVKKINGNDLVNGSILVHDPNPDNNTKINGSCAINYDEAAIDNAFALFAGGYPDAVHHIIRWREVN